MKTYEKNVLFCYDHILIIMSHMTLVLKNINEELKVATEAFFESESLTVDTSRREVCVVDAFCH